MTIFENRNDSVILVYLSAFGCLTYTQAMAETITNDLHLILSEANTDAFKAYRQDTLSIPRTKLSLITESLSLRKKINRLLDNLLKEKGSFILYFPAFHPLNELFLKWGKKNNIKTILTIHDYYTHEGEKSTITEALQNRFIKTADAVIFLTEYVKNQAIAALGQNDKFKVWPHPIIHTGVLNTLAHSARPKLLCLGRVVDYKNIPTLIKSIKGLDITQLTIAGQQFPERNYNTEDDPRIRIINKNLSTEEINDLLLEHHILVLPYLSTSQSGILTLGIATEMVMVITKVGGMVEQLSQEEAVWVEPTEEGIRKGIESLIKSELTYNRVKEAIRLSDSAFVSMRQI